MKTLPVHSKKKTKNKKTTTTKQQQKENIITVEQGQSISLQIFLKLCSYSTQEVSITSGEVMMTNGHNT